MLRRIFRIVHYAALLLKIGGPKVFFTQLGRKIYSRDILFGFEKDLDTDGVRVSSKLPYSWRQASEQDMEELLVMTKDESKESAHELIERKWFYERGFHDCYVARTTDIGELCFVAWLISTKDGDLVNQGFKSRLPSLKDGEVLLENLYTLEKYRGNRVFTSVVTKLCGLAKSRGYKRMIAYVRKDNTACLGAFKKLNFREFEEIPELKLFFFTRRKHN